ncbi:MAG: hypothetical protein R6W31_15590 [Bacteroidales bacterium]
MKIAITCLGIAITAVTMAQNAGIQGEYEAKENLRELGSTDGTGNVRTFDNRYEGVKGSPYVFETWYPGEVFLNSKKKVAISQMNYNCFENEIAYKEPASEVIRLLNRYTVDFFQINVSGESLTFVPVKLGEDAEPVFVRILYDAASKVYKVHQKEFLKANYEGGYSADRKYDEFVDKYDILFMKQGENTLYKAKNSKKYMISLFPEKENEISSFIKEEKLDLKQDESIVKLMVYFDSL